MTALRISRFLIGIIGVSLSLIGVAYIVDPVALLAVTGGFSLDNSALTDARATYGGIQLGLGLYLLLEWRSGLALRGPLILLWFTFVSVGGTRLCGYLLYGNVSAVHLVAGIGELAMATILVFLLRRLPD